MKCPRCLKGLAPKFVWGYNSNGEEYNILTHNKCPHCDGTGEIQDGDVWKCLITCADNRIDDFHMYLIRCDGGWKDEEEREIDFLDDSKEWMVTPICRLKEVK